MQCTVLHFRGKIVKALQKRRITVGT